MHLYCCYQLKIDGYKYKLVYISLMVTTKQLHKDKEKEI